MASVQVAGLSVLDLTDTEVQQALHVAEADLVSTDYALTQAIAAWAREHRNEGILAPSAALNGASILVVFGENIHKLSVIYETITLPPARSSAANP